MYEAHDEPLLPRRAFLARLALHAAAAFLLVLFSLALGALGYRVLENLTWVDAILNAAMLLGGMGPVNAPVTTAGKLFASAYALYCGLVFLLVAGILFTPIFHRLLHYFHLDEKDEDGGGE